MKFQLKEFLFLLLMFVLVILLFNIDRKEDFDLSGIKQEPEQDDFSPYNEEYNKDINSINKTNSNNSNSSDETLADSYKIMVNYPVPLSYKSKQEIFEMRRNAVRNSIFAYDGYQPSDSVFGQIVSNKPWYSSQICKDINTNLAKITGPSEESRFINNPTMLVAIEFPFLWSNVDDEKFCSSSINQLIPKSIYYSKSKNIITVKYAKLPFDAKGGFFYQFNGINAADLGYRYAYVDSKSTLNIRYSASDNISNNVQEFQNFIHLGASCKHEGGCNNGSPRQPVFEFQYDKGSGGGKVYIKLWKKRPASPAEKADITEIIVIES